MNNADYGIRIVETTTFGTETDHIEGFCDIPSWQGTNSVIVIMKNMDRWSMGGSMCLPSNTDDAKVVLDTYNAAFKALAALQEGK